MLSTDLSTIVIGSLALLAVVAAIFSYRKALHSEKYLRANSERSISLSKLAQFECDLTELSDSYDALLASHKKLRARISMRELRKRRKSENGVDTEPEPVDKEALRAKARSIGLLK